jgi:hypothetical protein
MAINYSNVTKRIFDILVGSGHDLMMGDEDAKKTLDPEIAVRFFITDLSSMVFMDKKEDTVRLYISNGQDEDKVERLKNSMQKTAEHFMLKFTVKNYGKTLQPKDFAFQIAVAESVSMTGTTKSSYQNFGSSKLIIRHSKSVNEQARGARSRSIKAIYVENSAGERFQLHTKWLTGARTMARHVAAGGTPYDDIGSKISALSEEYSILKRFVHHANRQGFVNEQTSDLIGIATTKTENIYNAMRKMQFENLSSEVSEDAEQERMDQLKGSFTKHITNQAVETALPYLYKLVQEKELLDAGHSALKKVEDAINSTPSIETINLDRNDHNNPINLNFSDNDTAIKHTAEYMMDHIAHDNIKSAISDALRHYDSWNEDQKNHFNGLVRNMIRKVVRINTEHRNVSVGQEAFESIKQVSKDFAIERILSK